MFKDNAVEALKKSGLKVTKPRMWIVEYLDGNKNHPTAIDIFENIRKEKKNMSFATVYNTLEILVKQGIVRQLKTDEKSCRFDPNTDLHGHFYCKYCGSLYDIEIDQKDLFKDLDRYGDIDGYEIVLYGKCNSCKKQS